MDAVEQRDQVRIGIEPARINGRYAGALALIVAGVVLASALFAMTLAGGRASGGTTDMSYDQIEAERGAYGLVATGSTWTDDSDERIESQRGGLLTDGNWSYDQIEQLRGSISAH